MRRPATSSRADYEAAWADQRAQTDAFERLYAEECRTRIDGDRVVKRRDYCRPKVRRRLLMRWRRSKAAREYRCYRMLWQLGIPCPQDVRVDDRRNWLGLLTWSEFSVERLPGAVNLGYLCLLERFANRRNDRRWRLAIARRLAGWVRHMHDHDFHPLNLHFRNLLVVPDSPADPPDIYFIDVVSGRFGWRFRRPYLTIKDLAFLYRDARALCSPRERIAFLHAYYGTRKLSPRQRLFANWIVAYTERKWGAFTCMDEFS